MEDLSKDKLIEGCIFMLRIRLGDKRKLQVVRWGAAYLTQILREVFYWR